MSNQSIRDLVALGVSRADIELAQATQAAQRAAGYPVQSLAVLCGVAEPRQRAGGMVQAGAAARPDGTDEVTRRALRRRGAYDQAALILTQQALHESAPERATMARQAAETAKTLSLSQQLEFDFFGGGNMSFSHQFHDAVCERLKDAGVTGTKRGQVIEVLYTIIRHLRFQSFECGKVAADLCEICGIDKGHMAKILNTLEGIGAIRRVRKGRLKIIAVNPEAAYRGDVNRHGEVVELYKLEVLDGRQPEPSGPETYDQ